MSIRNLFFRESECKKPSNSPFPFGLRASHPFCGLPRFASRASDCAAAARRARPRCFAPFLAACPASRRRLRTAVALSGPSSSSVLRTLFAACPALRRGLRTALPLRGVLVLGASHPFCGLPRFASRASGYASAARRARPRCFAPFLANRNPGPKPGA